MTVTGKTDPIRIIIKPAVFLLCLLPFALLLWNFFTENLSANPLSDIRNDTGIWTLRFIVITLSVTPLRTLTGWNTVQRMRRMVGLFAFFYGFLHFASYVYLDKFFDWQEIIRDIARRPYITVGLAAFTILTCLAVTSPNFIVKWMSGKRWRILHRLVYVSAICGVIHYLWLVKADTERPLVYGAIVVFLLGFRVWTFLAHRAKKAYRLGTTTTGVSESELVRTLPD